MKYHILTLFPEMIEQGLHTSILGRAINNGYISLETTNIRDFSANKFNRVDDYPYGGVRAWSWRRSRCSAPTSR